MQSAPLSSESATLKWQQNKTLKIVIQFYISVLTVFYTIQYFIYVLLLFFLSFTSLIVWCQILWSNFVWPPTKSNWACGVGHGPVLSSHGCTVIKSRAQLDLKEWENRSHEQKRISKSKRNPSKSIFLWFIYIHLARDSPHYSLVMYRKIRKKN